jgi:hypothetical protein
MRGDNEAQPFLLVKFGTRAGAVGALSEQGGGEQGGKLVAVLTQRRATNQELSFVRRSVAVLWLVAGRLEECHTIGSPKLGCIVKTIHFRSTHMGSMN